MDRSAVPTMHCAAAEPVQSPAESAAETVYFVCPIVLCCASVGGRGECRHTTLNPGRVSTLPAEPEFKRVLLLLLLLLLNKEAFLLSGSYRISQRRSSLGSSRHGGRLEKLEI